MSPALPLMLLLLQAVPAPPVPLAPPAPPPAPAEPPPELLGWSLGLTIGGAYRLPPAAREVPPALGFSVSTSVGWRYARLGNVELGLAAVFSYQRFASTVRINKLVAPGQELPFDDTRAVSMGDFVGLQTVTLDLGRLRPWAGLGGGVSLGHFATPEPKYHPGRSSPTMPIVEAGLGFHLEVAPQTDGGLQIDYVRAFAPTFVTGAGDKFQVFGDRLAVRLEMQYRF